MEYKSAFLNIYFGPLPPYFDFWAKSCVPNQDNFHWYVYNNHISEKIEYNDAVTIIPYDFDRLYNDIRNETEIKIPYEGKRIVCDCRVMIYALREKHEDLSRYDFIGYNDLDMIYGEIKCFMPDNPYQYSMISGNDGRPCGPFTLFNRKYIKNILMDDNIKNRMEKSFGDKIYNSDCYKDKFLEFAPVSGNNYKDKIANMIHFEHLDESEDLLEISKKHAPVFCCSNPLQPTRTNRFNYRKSIAFWENGKLTVMDNRGHIKEGAFFHFSRFKSRSRFKINYTQPIRNNIDHSEKFGVYKYGIVRINSNFTKLKMMLTMLY